MSWIKIAPAPTGVTYCCICGNRIELREQRFTGYVNFSQINAHPKCVYKLLYESGALEDERI